ncbi:hypothetical protein Patl1_30937 [Pistacia atlantica]|uniref:Uncharacterized protein n=1 Tax=Pistacia atlantica TaxID=434234 RepID=A0ACC1ABC9_9ROSI|nr:hypothetical protein Patl1_30937 [Pistacia atlantica]
MSRDAPRGLEIKVQPTGGGPPMASTSGTMATSPNAGEKSVTVISVCIGNIRNIAAVSERRGRRRRMIGANSGRLSGIRKYGVDSLKKLSGVKLLFSCLSKIVEFSKSFDFEVKFVKLEKMGAMFRIGLLYVISGFGGSVMSALFLQQSISVGASGALFGLLGAMLSELIANWTIYANKFAAMLTLIFIIVVNLAMGILPHVDNFAHIGGFFSGFLLGFVLLIRPQFGWVSQKSVPPGYTVTSVKSKHKTYQYVLWVFSLILLIVGFTLGLVQLSRGVNMNDYCSRCHYMSCIPTSLWNCKAQEVYCQSTQIGNEVNLTCSGSGKSNIYPLSAADNPLKLDDLCSEICS